MKKVQFFSICLFLFYLSSFGKTVSLSDAKTVGYNFLKQHINCDLNTQYDLNLVNNSYYNLFNYYILNGKHCFVIVSADDLVNPILGYDNSRPFVIENAPEHLYKFLENFSNQINSAKVANYIQPVEIEQKWNYLLNNVPLHSAQKTNKTTSVSPLIQTIWNQGTGYNNLCPTDAGCTCCGGHTPTGCVATAMAQIMKYWNYPAHGIGTNSYTPSSYPPQLADFGSSTYNWLAMPDSTYSSDVALIMYHAGVSVNMNYGCSGSGSYTTGAAPSAENALKTYFCYNPLLHGINRSVYADADWLAQIKSEIDNSRPVIYSGDGSGGGHAWVVDGYDASNYFHCNWGWGGMDNGYYYMNNMVPAPTSSGDYNLNQQAIVGIEPNTPALSVSGPTSVCIGYEINLTFSPSGGTITNLNPSIANVSTSGVVTGLSKGKDTIIYSTTSSCGNRYIKYVFTVVDSTTPFINTILSNIDFVCSGMYYQGGSSIYLSGSQVLFSYVPLIKKLDISTGTFTHIAGGGTTGLGDGGPATSAQITISRKMAFDTAGNIYFSEGANNRIRKITRSTGIINTIAGMGGPSGYSGDGGPATDAHLGSPFSTVIDNYGNLYFVDLEWARIRKINTAGIITTIAGNGGTYFNGDNIPATAAAIQPNDIAIDQYGNLFISDYHPNSRIRKIDTLGIITTVAGSGWLGTAYLSTGDGGMATAAKLNNSTVEVDTNGNVYFYDGGYSFGGAIRIVDKYGVINKFIGGGTNYPGDGGVAVDSKTAFSCIFPYGNSVYIFDRRNGLGSFLDTTYELRKTYFQDCSTLETYPTTNINNNFKVFPNPNNGLFSLVIPQSNNRVSISISDFFEREVYYKDFGTTNNTKFDVDIQNLPVGFYVIKVVTNYQTFIEKILLKK